MIIKPTRRGLSLDAVIFLSFKLHEIRPS